MERRRRRRTELLHKFKDTRSIA